MSGKVYGRRVELMEAELGDELVALDVDAGACFGFNEVATSVWRLLETPKSIEAIEAALIEEYDVDPTQCRVELSHLLNDMQAKSLITLR